MFFKAIAAITAVKSIFGGARSQQPQQQPNIAASIFQQELKRAKEGFNEINGETSQQMQELMDDIEKAEERRRQRSPNTA